MTDSIIQGNESNTIEGPSASKSEADAEDYKVFPRDGHGETSLQQPSSFTGDWRTHQTFSSRIAVSMMR
jgi:hypothetical protein